MNFEENNNLKGFNRNKDLDAEAVGAAHKRLKQKLPLFESINQNKCEFEIEPGHSECSYSVNELDADDEEHIRKYVKNLVKRTDTFFELLDIRNWKKITNITLKAGEERLAIDTVLPEGYRIYGYAFEGYDVDFDSVRMDDQAIFIVGPFNTLRSVLVLLHEIGHVVDNEKNGGYEHVDDKKLDDLVKQYRQERNATAFQYRVFRTLVRDQNIRTDSLAVTHGSDLDSYKKYIRRKIANLYEAQNHYYDTLRTDTVIGGLEDGWEDDREEYLRESWLDWKRTEHFKQWFDELDGIAFDDEELFDLWCTWVGETSYEFWHDLEEGVASTDSNV